MNRLHRLALVLVPTALAGCANINSIHHRFKADEGEGLSIDAKQRMVYAVTKDFGNGKQWKAVCAEPSPDALAALSASGGADAAVLGKALGLAFSSQEGAASIGLRTQTIQILRDSMYRLCEGYASGGLDDIGFARLQRRYQSIMLGLLAIEQLTGAVVARQVAITGNASARLGQNLSQITVMVQEARGKALRSKAAQDTAQATLDAAMKTQQDAKAALEKALADAGGATNDAVKKAQTAFDIASKSATDAKAALDKAMLEALADSAELASLENMRKEIDRAAVVASTVAAFAEATPHNGPPDGESFRRVADTVRSIVLELVNHDYTKESCMDALLSRQFSSAHDTDTVIQQMRWSYCRLALEESALSAAQSRAGTPEAAAAVAAQRAEFLQRIDAQTNRIFGPAPDGKRR